MKFLGSLITFVVSAYAVFGAPAINQYDNTFSYWIDTTKKTATITGVKDKYNYTVTLNPYITVEGQTYTVNQIGSGAFSNTNVETIIVNDNIKSLNISPNAFQSANYIRNIELNTEKVTAHLQAFDGISTNVGFQGVGTRSLADSLAKELLKSWNLPVGKDYSNVSNDAFNKALYNLAYKVKKNFYLNDKVAYSSNVASVLAVKAGSYNGIARVYRILAKNMGFKYNDVHVGGDGGRYSWNYVYIVKNSDHKRWFNLDIVNTKFTSRYNANVFKTMDQQKNSIQSDVNPRNWIIYNDEYNYPGEYIIINGVKEYFDPRIEEFYSWLVRNRSGVQA